MSRFSKETGRPVTFALLQNDADPTQWKRVLEAAGRCREQGLQVTPQVAVRPTGLLMGFESNVHPFLHNPVYQGIRHLPVPEQVKRLSEPSFREKLITANGQLDNPMVAFVMQSFHKLFPLGDPPDYEPTPDRSVAAIAEREGRRPEEVALDLMCRRDGRELLYFPILNYSGFDFEPIREMLEHPATVVGLSDGGAHCGMICDASSPTFLLTHWARDRKRGPRLPIERVVAGQTRRTAELYGLCDRGLLAPGLLADVNVIDFDALRIDAPNMVFDLPSDAGRLVQRAHGYRHTLKSGRVIVEDGETTGSLPGALIRGPRPDTRPSAH
jgi:N-acyl-D-aspartate/D-glutamate deacylase